jgi:hypothetical protein
LRDEVCCSDIGVVGSFAAAVGFLVIESSLWAFFKALLGNMVE